MSALSSILAYHNRPRMRARHRFQDGLFAETVCHSRGQLPPQNMEYAFVDTVLLAEQSGP